MDSGAGIVLVRLQRGDMNPTRTGSMLRDRTFPATRAVEPAGIAPLMPRKPRTPAFISSGVQASGSGGQWQAEEVERLLRLVLFRFDCPTAEVLGQYLLGLVPAEERPRIALHAETCDECGAEVETLRELLFG